MTQRLVHRPARVTRPVQAPTEQVLPAPPPIEAGAAASVGTQMLMPILGAMTSVTMMIVMRNGNILFMMVAGLIFIVAVGSGIFMALSGRGQATRNRAQQREMYLDHLERSRADLGQQNTLSRENAMTVAPAPEALPGLIRDRTRLWERRSNDPDFLHLRLGAANRDWRNLRIPEPESATAPHDPAMLAETERLVDDASVIKDMPVQVDLDSAGNVAVIGERAETLAAARVLIAQASSLHSPDDLHIALVFPRESAGDWAGVDQLPHLVNGRLFDGPVPARRVAQSLAALSKVVGGEIFDRIEQTAIRRRIQGQASASTRLLIIVDGHGHVAQRLRLPDLAATYQELGITIVHLLTRRLDEPDDLSVRISLAEGSATVEDVGWRAADDRPPTHGVRVDEATPTLLRALARQLSPLRVSTIAREVNEVASEMEITDLLGIDSPDAIDTAALWQPRSPGDFLRVPIGVDDAGVAVLLDLKESAQLGMGPHGICVGATGSGKSEMLRTLVLGLAMSHPPEDLSMILVDYKGGAAFSPFEQLPHLAGLMDNLADDAQLTERARQSLAGEVVRRQQQLKDAGSLASIGHYRELRRLQPELAPMPHLFVVIDEFGELLTAEPEFTDLFLQIGRIGRSIGVHLLLSSQRIEGGKLRGLDTYLSYRLGLRTFSEAESQTVLDTKDAFTLPAIPGYGYLKVDTSVYKRFRSGYVSGPVTDLTQPSAAAAGPQLPIELPIYNTIASGDSDLAEPQPQLETPEVGTTLVQACVESLRDEAITVAPVWLPPLPARLTLSQVLEDQRPTPGLGTLIGLLDDPGHQAQSPWQLDLAGGGGHLAIIGGPQSGRSTLLRTIGASLALTHTPAQVNIYGMDFTGGGLLRLEGFPHVGGVAIRSNRERVGRLIEELRGMLATRERLFQAHNIESMAQLRRMHADGQLPGLPAADVVWLIDGYGALRNEFEDLADAVNDIVGRAGSFGIHAVVTLTRWGELRVAQQSEFGTRIELRLNDPGDSNIDRKLAQIISKDTPGRGLTDGKLFGQVSLPVLTDVPDDEIGDELERLASQSAASWSGPNAAPIRLLPLELDPDALPDVTLEPDAVPIGLRQDSMEPALWEFDTTDQHLLVFGDSRCGKSTLLRTIARGLIERFTSDELVIAVMDVRGTVPSAIPDDFLGGHAKTPTQANGLATSIAAELTRRATTPAAELGQVPRVVLLVDDHDILSAGGTEILDALKEHLPAARDLGLSIVLTRPVAGSSRAMFSPVLQGMRDTGGALFVMSGDRTEGQIVPRVSAQFQPPGRGLWVRRAQPPHLVQTAMEPDESGSAGNARRAVS
ncbi:MAG: type VII secretion protein EccCa [Arachnia sp.]